MTLGERLQTAELSQQIEAACLRAVRRAMREVFESRYEIDLSDEGIQQQTLADIEALRTTEDDRASRV